LHFNARLKFVYQERLLCLSPPADRLARKSAQGQASLRKPRHYGGLVFAASTFLFAPIPLIRGQTTFKKSVIIPGASG